MRMYPTIRALPLLPGAWIASLRSMDLDTAYGRSQRWSKRVIQWLGYRIEVKGQDQIHGIHGAYFVCNHQGTLDPVPILATCGVPLSFNYKKENANLPIMGRWAKKLGCIHFDRSSREGNIHMLREAVRILKQDRNLLIFPEGTRSKGDAMHPFMVKSLQPARIAKAPIVPVTISHCYGLDVPCKDPVIYVIYGKPLLYEDYKNLDMNEVSNQLYAQIQANIV